MSESDSEMLRVKELGEMRAIRKPVVVDFIAVAKILYTKRKYDSLTDLPDWVVNAYGKGLFSFCGTGPNSIVLSDGSDGRRDSVLVAEVNGLVVLNAHQFKDQYECAPDEHSIERRYPAIEESLAKMNVETV